MRDPLLPRLGAALRQERRRRTLSQAQLAARVGRPKTRISELESDLLHDRSGRDRLALLTEACDALDLVLLAVPRESLQKVEAILETAPARRAHPDQTALFDELFVDLSDPTTTPRRSASSEEQG